MGKKCSIKNGQLFPCHMALKEHGNNVVEIMYFFKFGDLGNFCKWCGAPLKEDKSKEIALSVLKELNEQRKLYIPRSTGFRESDKNNLKHITARIRDGYTHDELIGVVVHKCRQWGRDAKMREYLRPSTLFSAKFSQYLTESKVAKPVKRTGVDTFLEGLME